MEFSNIILETEGHLAILTVNRPKALNALNADTMKDLNDAIDAIAADDTIWAVIVTGAGDKAFVAGADIAFMKDLNVLQGRQWGIDGNRVFRKLESLEKPTIAAINGFALGGGCELAMVCDIRIAAKNARFGQPEVGLGITPGFGGTQRLARIVGDGVAKELIYTGAAITADEAWRVGLVNRVVELEELMATAKKLAGKIMANAPIAIKFAKEAINRGRQVDIDTAVAIEAQLFGQCFATEDQKEGMTAFVEKRKVEAFKNK